MNYNYFNHWVPSGNKRGKDKLSLFEAQRRYEDANHIGNTFYILVGDEIKPTYLINYVSYQLITIKKLNSDLLPILKIDYKKLENLNNDKLFLSKVSVDYFDSDLNQIENKSIGFVKAEYSKNKSIYKIHNFPYYLYTNYENNTEVNGFFNKELVKKELLWKDYPKFGDWDWMIEDIKMMEEILNV